MKTRNIAVLILVVGISFIYSSNVKAQQAPEIKKNPFVNDELATKEGRRIYHKVCWVCHGKTGLGDGPSAGVISTVPRNFTMDEIVKKEDGELFNSIQNGMGDMQAYKDMLSEEQTWKLTNYIRELQKAKVKN